MNVYEMFYALLEVSVVLVRQRHDGDSVALKILSGLWGNTVEVAANEGRQTALICLTAVIEVEVGAAVAADYVGRSRKEAIDDAWVFEADVIEEENGLLRRGTRLPNESKAASEHLESAFYCHCLNSTVNFR